MSNKHYSLDVNRLFLIREAFGAISTKFRSSSIQLPTQTRCNYDLPRHYSKQQSTRHLISAHFHISGDQKPIHRDVGVALLQVYPVRSFTVNGLLPPHAPYWQAKKPVNSRSEFLGPVNLVTLTFKGEVVGLSNGHGGCHRIKYLGPVLRVDATRECVKTALIFPDKGPKNGHGHGTI